MATDGCWISLAFAVCRQRYLTLREEAKRLQERLLPESLAVSMSSVVDLLKLPTLHTLSVVGGCGCLLGMASPGY